MDPLGVTEPTVVDVFTLCRWSGVPPKDLPDSNNFGNQEKTHDTSPFPFNKIINEKVALWNGNIACLGVDAIVHTTNEALNDTNPLSLRILQRAGPSLKQDLQQNIKICRTGDAKVTKGYLLPARYIVHTVGPKYHLRYQTAAESALYSSYFKVLQSTRENKWSTLAVCPINSLRRGYPPHDGAHIALRTIRRFLEKHLQDIDVIVFAVEDADVGIYDLLMPLYFPRSKAEEEYALFYLPRDIGGPNGEPFIAERQIRIVDKPFVNDGGFEESVDLAAQVASPVAVGKTAFARMHGDVDKKRVSQQRPSLSADILTTEVARKNRYERLLRKARTEDLRSISNLRCIYPSGEDRFGRPVVVIIGQRFLGSEIDLHKALLYLIQIMDPVVQRDFIVVYFHTLTCKENLPPLGFLKDAYNVLDYKYKKNLRAFYIVHPTFWSRLMTWWFTTFTASGIKSKVHTLGGVEYLYYVMAPNQLDAPTFVMDYDAQVNGVRYCQPPSQQSQNC